MRQRKSKSLLPMSGQHIELEETNRRQTDSSSTISSYSLKKDSVHEIPTYFAFVTLALLCLLYGGVYLLDISLPSPYTISDEHEYPEAFIAERAQDHLRGLTAIGPRVVGSTENEIEAVKYLNDEINKILSVAHKNYTITKDNQLVSGSFFLKFGAGFINSYGNVQNIVVKIDGKNDYDSILINSHFDSVPTSPGASDDGIMVAVMLETLRKLTQTYQDYERNIIFLFNGAEETILQAAHGFITKHKWAKSCKTIINLEAGGHGGRAILFQSGPRKSSALMSHYTSVPYPYAQAAGEEVFQSNVLPSDTDFRIFRDFGNLSGFDMAFARNGYRYHTKYDNFKDLPLGSYQHAGSNLLALVKSIAKDPEVMADDNDKVVYFDVLNWFIISYSMLAAYIINIIVALASLIVAILSARNAQLGFTKTNVLYIFYTTLTILGSWIIAIGFTLVIAVVLDTANSTMTWYGSPIIVFGLYVAPILGCFTLIMWIFNYFGPHEGKSLGTQSQIQMHIIRLLWTLVLFVGTLLKVRCVYVVMLCVLFNTLAALVILLVKWQHTARKWQYTAFVLAIFPAIMAMYLGHILYGILIPISGRMGAAVNPEMIIGLLTVLFSLLVCTHLMSFTVLVKRQYILPIVLFATFFITLIVAVANGAFPYSGDRESPAPQRFSVSHTNRVHHNANGTTFDQSGIFVVNSDRNAPRSVMHDIGLNDNYDITSDCKLYPACGLPITSARSVATADVNSWKPFRKAIINEQIAMNYTTKALSSNIRQYSFVVEGPDHLTVNIRPHEGTKIVTTSLNDIETDELLFITHIYGLIKTNLVFTVDVQADSIEEPLMDFAVSGKYYNLKGQERIVKEFGDFIQKFPDWADVTPALATYESYVI